MHNKQFIVKKRKKIKIRNVLLYKTLGSVGFLCNIASVFSTQAFGRKPQIQVQLHPPLSWCSSVCNLVRILIQKYLFNGNVNVVYCRGFETKKEEMLKRIEMKTKKKIYNKKKHFVNLLILKMAGPFFCHWKTTLVRL